MQHTGTLILTNGKWLRLQVLPAIYFCVTLMT